jgi:hypothetical protein
LSMSESLLDTRVITDIIMMTQRNEPMQLPVRGQRSCGGNGPAARNRTREEPRGGERRPGTASRFRWAGLCALAVLWVLFLASAGKASEGELPVIQGKTAVATVDGVPITLETFNRALAESHSAHLPGKKAGKVDYSGIMDRLVNTRLLVIEARNMGLNEQPEFRKLVDDYAKQALMELLLERQVKDVVVDDQRVDLLYREKIRRWKLKSYRFQKEEDIREAERQVKAGADFSAVMKKAVEAGKAQGEKEGEEVKDRDLTQPVAEQVSKMKTGEVSPIVSLGQNGFLIFQLAEVVVPKEEDPALREEARREVLDRMRVEQAGRYVEKLKKEQTHVNQELLDGLDFEAEEPGFDRLREDERVLVEISGEKPYRVRDLAEDLEQRFYHGMPSAIRGKMVNRKKHEVLAGVIERKILLREALRQGLDQSAEYRERVADYEQSSLFGAFVKKVVVPEIHLDESELKKYYEKHKESFSTPKMVRIKEMVFRAKPDALTALRKLNQGTDFNWLLSHAEGQVTGDAMDRLRFDGNLLSVRTLAEDLQKTLSDVRTGDCRLYESPAKLYYVLYVYYVLEPTLNPYESVQKEVREKVFNEKMNRAIVDYADKLREYYTVKIFDKNLKK